MLRNLQAMENYTIGARDGVIGLVKDFYFDDATWMVRYLVVQTGDWLSRREVLISPIGLGAPDHSAEIFPTYLTQQQVKGSPDVDTQKPVSRQYEREFLGYYGYPFYWRGDSFWGGALSPSDMLINNASASVNYARTAAQGEVADLQAFASAHEKDDPHLRSCNAVINHHVRASDGDAGHVAGFLMDETTWAIQQLIVKTNNWWLGHQVLVAAERVEHINWAESLVTVDLCRDAIKAAPTYE